MLHILSPFVVNIIVVIIVIVTVAAVISKFPTSGVNKGFFCPIVYVEMLCFWNVRFYSFFPSHKPPTGCSNLLVPNSA